LEDFPRAVGGAVVDHNDLVRDAAEFQLKMQVLDGGRYAAFLVAGGDDHRQESEWGIFNRR
jgi:DNA gyrase inhibitor GyrI